MFTKSVNTKRSDKTRPCHSK